MLPNESSEASNCGYCIVSNGQLPVEALKWETGRENLDTCLINNIVMQVDNAKVPINRCRNMIILEKCAAKPSYQIKRWKER